MKPIHQRPATVQTRRQAGHWRGDVIVGAGQQSVIATLVERKFRTTILVPLPCDHTAQSVGDALLGAFTTPSAQLRRTLTWDQGNEMFHHQRVEQHTSMKIYFCDPRSPWPRESNENLNGLLRQTFRRPRLCLGDRTPNEAMRRRARHGTTMIRNDQ
jgi:transposase, IS30 family